MTYRADLEHQKWRQRRNWRPLILSALLVILLAGAGFGLFGWNYLFKGMPTLPDKETLWTMGRSSAIEFRTSDNKLLLRRGPFYGRAVSAQTLPDYVVNAFIAGEDKRFYKHDGVDTMAIFRAMFANWEAGSTVQGGSTLTQQIVKNLLLTPEQTLRRKAQEMRLALEIEKRLSKDEILALYLNRIYLGNRAYGIDGAALAYFDKHATELTLSEASFLAALPKAPTRLSQENDLSAARTRQKYVLDQMVSAGFVSAEEAATAFETEISFVDYNPEDPTLGYVADYVSGQLKTLLPKVPDDAIVTITLSPDLQNMASEKLNAVLDEKGNTLQARNGAIMIIDKSGRIRAMVGGRDYQTSKFNRAVQAMRQPGSAFKAFVYAAAMEAGLTPGTVRVDEKTWITKDWAPRNYTGRYYGPVMLQDAFAHSLNVIAAKLTQEVGQNKVISTAHKLGLGTDLLSVPSIALGSDETTLLDLTRAYGAFALKGKRLDPYIIAKVEDSRGEIHYQRKPYPPASVLTERAAENMDFLLRRVVSNGSGWRAQLENHVTAGKTGTSQNWRDAWFIGYAGNYITGVWVGNDDNTHMNKVTGGSLPAEIWKSVMTEALKDVPADTETPNTQMVVGEMARARADFYSELSSAFDAAQPRQMAVLPGGRAAQ